MHYGTLKDISVVIHNGSDYDFHLLITELANEFRSEMTCIPEDKEKYISFSIPLQKKNRDDNFITYNLKFIDSARFMAGSLDTHVNNLSELYNCDCKDDDEKEQNIKIKFSEKSMHSRCKTSRKRFKQPIQLLKDKFSNTYSIYDNNINKFILLLRKGIYSYEHIYSYEKFNEQQLPSTDKFYSNFNFKNITKHEYKHAKKVWDTFKIKNLGEYHDLYVQSDTSQLADVFEKSRNLCLREYSLDPGYFYATPGLAFEACLKVTKVNIELFTDIHMLLMFEKGIRGGLSQAIHRYATANNKYMSNYSSQQLSTFLMYLDANNLYANNLYAKSYQSEDTCWLKI